MIPQPAEIGGVFFILKVNDETLKPYNETIARTMKL